MIRLCVILFRVALVLSMSLIFEGAKLWLFIKPVKRIRQWRTKRKMRSWHEEHGGPPDEILEVFHEEPREVRVNEQVASVVRSVLKSAGGGLVGAGVVTSGELEVLAGAAAILVGLAWSWWVKRRAA